jgi:hypothetical protein
MTLTHGKLKTLPGILTVLPQEDPYSFTYLPQTGIPHSGLVELSGAYGSGKTEVVLKFLQENQSLKAAWIEKDFTIFPAAFPSHQVELQRILFIDISSPQFTHSPNWCASQILKSQLFQVLIFSHLQFTETELRRLQILTKQTGTLIFLIRQTPSVLSTWPISLQVTVKRSESSCHPLLTVLKSRNHSPWHSKSE